MTKEKILLVEDCPVTRMLYEFTLKQNGYEVICCNCGQEALKSLNENLPHIILTDWEMPPGINGCEMISVIRKAGNKDLPIILMTAAKILPSKSNCDATAMFRKDQGPEKATELIKKLIYH